MEGQSNIEEQNLNNDIESVENTPAMRGGFMEAELKSPLSLLQSYIELIQIVQAQRGNEEALSDCEKASEALKSFDDEIKTLSLEEAISKFQLTEKELENSVSIILAIQKRLEK